ncbi:MAG: hypothetical protein DWI57_16470, partial [Chloroflexi bacterium]
AQALRVYDGYAWHRLPPTTGNWMEESVIPRADLRAVTLRAVARDGFGKTLQAQRTMQVDTLVVQANLTDNLPVALWQTDASPVLSVTWPAPQDASRVVSVTGQIDRQPSTQPMTNAPGNQLLKTLDGAGIYYAHVLVQDGAGNRARTSSGPYLVNRSTTPSLNLADGYLDIRGGEYPNGSLLGYDPYALWKPAALWGTWDSQKLYLGFPGNRWNSESHLVFYLDTQAGGLGSALPGGPEHKLPFDADFALLVGGESTKGYDLYQANGSWQLVGDPKSFAAREQDTEVVLDRAEIKANGGLGLLVLAEDGDGAWAVLPASARPASDEVLTGALALGDSMQWASLGNGVKPNAGMKQVLAPQITVVPEWDNVVVSGRTAIFQLLIHNPDVAPYSVAPLSLQVDEKLALLSAQGARCQSCPERGHDWTLLVDVAAGGTQTVTVQANVLGQDVVGVWEMLISAGLANSGLPSAPQSRAIGQYWLDHGSVAMKQAKGQSEVYVQPGEYAIDVFADFDFSTVGRCFSQVEVNPGVTGWQPVCWLGDCTTVRGTISANASQQVQVRTTGSNGRSSQPLVVNVIADAIAPTTELSVTKVLSGNLAFVQGMAWDSFPTSRVPARVEVNIDGGSFYPALLTPGTTQTMQAADGQAVDAMAAHWRLPLHLTWEDGKRVLVMARSVDEAGNVGRAVGPMEIILDNLGPQLTMAQTGTLVYGTATDGSGVAGLEISLDGGLSYQPVSPKGGEWSFNALAWMGGQEAIAILRGTDVYGNRTILLTPFARSFGESYRLFLPTTIRSVGTEAEGVAGEVAGVVEATEGAEETAPTAPEQLQRLFLPLTTSSQ